MKMFDLLAQRARVTPQRPALEDLDNGTVYNYEQLNARAARFAAAATGHWQLQPGDRIAWLGHSRAEFFVMLYGCAKAGLILVPLNWRLAVPELQSLLADCQPRVLLFADEFTDSARALAELDADLSLVAVTESTPPPDQSPGHYETDLATVAPDLAPHPERDPDTPWYLLYTSGTTGRPKGVVQTFRMMLANYLNIGLAVDLTRNDVLLNVLPLFHTAGINLYASAVFMVGGCVLVARSFEPEQTFDVLANRATVFFGVPAVYQSLLDHPRFSADALAGVRSWGCGGAALSLPVARRFVAAGIHVRTGMGMTETGPTVFLLDEQDVLTKTGSVGRPQLLAEVKIVDVRGQDVAPGEAGELLIRGPGVTPGYWDPSGALRPATDADGWLHSGDVARCDADGCYYIVDRRKDMYISGGENVYPAEVERVLLEYPGIVEAAIIGVPDERWGETGRAFFSLSAEATTVPDDAQLSEFCRQHLAGYKVPQSFQRVTELPRNALGKVTKQVLRDDSKPA